MSDSDLELYGIVGRMFREIRESQDLSLETVSEYLQIAPKSLQRYECGERKIKMGTIKELCTFYKIEYDDFIKEAKLRFGKNLYIEEPLKIMQYYNQLNDIGKREAEKRVEELTHLPKYAQESENQNNTVEFSKEFIPTKDYLLPNAAHADEFIERAEHQELAQAEENIMDDENF